MPGAGRVEDPLLPEDLDPVAELTVEDGAEYQGLLVTGADLSLASGEGIHLSEVLLEDVRLTGAELPDARLDRVVMRRCELSGAVFSGLSASLVLFEDCRMSGLVATDGSLRSVSIRQGRLDGAILRFTKTKDLRLSDCDLTGADFQGADLSEARFERCDLSRAELWKVVAAGSVFASCRLEGLKGAAALRGAHVGADQVLSLAVSLMGELGIALDADDL